METIKKPGESIVKAWGTQKSKEISYRPLRYLLRKETEDGTLLHNVMTGELVLLTKEETALMDRPSAFYEASMDELIAHHFLVPLDYDEKKTVYQLRQLLRLVHRRKEVNGYTILPTTNCNARCFYCYEANFQRKNMSRETADQVVQYILDHCGKRKKVSLSWFGGEPTVGAARIDQICESLTEHEIEYSSSMISNAYLLDAEMAKKAKELWKLTNVQITLDGTEAVYNEVKAYVTTKGSPYRQVIQNIQSLLEQEIRVSIRMNLDRHNADNLRELIAELAEKFGGNQFFHAYVWPLFDDCGYDPVLHEESDRLWLLEKQTELNDLIRESGMYQEREKVLPSLRYNYCMADNDTSLIVSPDGTFSKCEHCTEENLGNLWDGVTAPEALAAWKETQEYPECETCALFPRCVNLKHCFSSGKCYEEKRSNDFRVFDSLMPSTYQKWKKEKEEAEAENEEVEA